MNRIFAPMLRASAEDLLRKAVSDNGRSYMGTYVDMASYDLVEVR